jgi:hypothetical protein
VDAHRGRFDRPGQRADEVQARAAAAHGFDLRDYFGLKDAKAGKPSYTWTLFSHPEQDAALLKDGWKSFGKVFLLAIVLDVVYQIIVLRLVYPGEAIIVAFILAIVPYLMLRGLVNRIASRK